MLDAQRIMFCWLSMLDQRWVGALCKAVILILISDHLQNLVLIRTLVVVRVPMLVSVRIPVFLRQY